MKILVTGATGFVGQNLIPHLLARGDEVIATARDSARAQSFAWFDKLRFVACDIHRPDEASLKLFGAVDAVVHLAWQGLPNYKALFHFEENLPADYRFLKALVDNGVKQLLVTGTCFEYGMQSGCLVETLPAMPANPYALAKDTLRKFLEALAVQREGLILQWARLFYMYGPGQNPNSLLSQLDRAVETGQRSFNMSGGEQLRDYLSIDEVAARLARLVQMPSCAGIVNICSGQPVSVRALVERQLRARGADIELNLGYYPYPDYEPMAFWGDGGKFYASACL